MATDIKQTFRSMGDPTDAELLMQFTKHGDDESFRLLVQRHYGLVMGVCRNILRSSHDAEDAFQATFLILARRCRSIRQVRCIAGWLQRVAYRTAIRLAKQKSRRNEVDLEPEDAVSPTGDSSLRTIHDAELMHRFYEELDGLPIKIRDALVLFYLERLPRRQAAELLDCTDSALKGRLAQGKKLLRQRLLRRGVALSVVAQIVITGHRQEAAASSIIVAETAELGAEVLRNPSGPVGSPSTSVILANQGISEMIRSTCLQPATALVATVVVMTVVASGVGEERSTPNAYNSQRSGTIELVASDIDGPPATVASQFASVKGGTPQSSNSTGTDKATNLVATANSIELADDGTVEMQHQTRLLKMQIDAAKLEFEAKRLAIQVQLVDNENDRLELKKKAASVDLQVLRLRHDIEVAELEHQLKQVESRSKQLAQTPMSKTIRQWTTSPVPVPVSSPSTSFHRVEHRAATQASNQSQPLVPQSYEATTTVDNGRIHEGSVVHVEVITGGLLDANSIIDEQLTVDASGQLALGAALGRLSVAGLTCVEAERLLQEQVRRELDGVIKKDVEVRVQVTLQTPRSPYRQPFGL